MPESRVVVEHDLGVHGDKLPADHPKGVDLDQKGVLFEENLLQAFQESRKFGIVSDFQLACKRPALVCLQSEKGVQLNPEKLLRMFGGDALDLHASHRACDQGGSLNPL